MWSPLRKIKMWNPPKGFTFGVLGVLGLAVYGIIAFELSLIVNVVALTVSLFTSVSVLAGEEHRKTHSFLKAFVISSAALVVFNVSFSFLQTFVALSISLFALWGMIRYLLFKDHDAGWFGALAVELIGLIFSMLILVVLGIVQILLF